MPIPRRHVLRRFGRGQNRRLRLSAPADHREKCREPALVRISVGVEDWRDLLHDFRQALDGVRP